MSNVFKLRIIGAVFACGSIMSCGYSSQFINNKSSNPAVYLSRTASILTTNGGEFKPTYKILFYGQSITSTKWTDKAALQIEKNYPKVNFVFKNLAIGGNDASLLERAVSRDIQETYPDLVIFHVYGDQRAYERIIRQIRSQTAAEIILQTDHVRTPVEPVCPVGLRMHWVRPEGCTGRLWLHQRNWDDYMSGLVIPALSSKYSAAIDQRRILWASYLRANKLPVAALLQDGLHPNEQGWGVAAKLFVISFNKLIKNSTLIKDKYVYDLPFAKLPVSNYNIDGNRIEIIAREYLSKAYTSSVDGVVAEKVPGCWLNSRTSVVPWVRDWPAIRQIGSEKPEFEKDTFKIVIPHLSQDAKDFKFNIFSKVHGYDGSGFSQQKFISNSGRIIIEPQDWVYEYAQKVNPQLPQRHVMVAWSREFLCDRSSYVNGSKKKAEIRYVVATGLTNSHHNVAIRVAPEDVENIVSIRVFKPQIS